ncbi:hypothetical protein ACOMHN_065359 [Nucella lapillus]
MRTATGTVLIERCRRGRLQPGARRMAVRGITDESDSAEPSERIVTRVKAVHIIINQVADLILSAPYLSPPPTTIGHRVQSHSFSFTHCLFCPTGMGVFGTKANVYSLLPNRCGAGDIAEHPNDLGYDEALDTCCRDHDLCPHIIHRFSWKYGLFNFHLHTLSHCRCDRR